MKTAKFKNGGCYVNPVCLVVKVSDEGVLCSSGVDQDFNSTLDGYVPKDETYW